MADVDPGAVDPQTTDISTKPISGVADEATASVGQQPAEPTSRLFVGNISSDVTDDDLKELFQAFENVSVTMPANPRNKRPMGYAFVDVGTPENAEQAVKDFQGKELRDKPINVQIARPEGERKVRKPKKRTKKPAGEDATAENGATGEATANGDTEGDKAKKPNKRRQNRRRKSSVGAVEDGAQQNITPAPRPKASRGDGVPSTDTLFVANLPVEFNNDQLMELFAEYNPTSAKVVLRSMPKAMIRKLAERGIARKTKGYGFVKFADHEAQEKGLVMNGKEHEGRELVVKVALEIPEGEEQEHEQEKSEGQTGEAAAQNVLEQEDVVA